MGYYKEKMTSHLFGGRAAGILVGLAAVVLLAFFFSYRILEVPTGLTVDESAFGYNAVLLSRTGRDQNGWRIPVFVLSINGKDWRQPVPQYYMTLFFKVFGPSVFNLRFSSVVIAAASAVLLFILAMKSFGNTGAVVTTIVFLATPILMIQSHMGLDNITPVPFVILWLLGIFLFSKERRLKYLVLAGLSLGTGFYTYKGMRGTVPVWAAITEIYLLSLLIEKHGKALWQEFFRYAGIFALSVGPFFLVIPLLERLYPCAVFDCQKVTISSFYDFFYPYISSFDLSFLFIKGDATVYHSTGRHGMLLLASLPLFLVGVWEAIKKKGFWFFVLVAFFTTPLFYGLVNSVFRASRLLAMIPLYSLVAGLGGMVIWNQRKKVWGKVLVGVMIVIFALNYGDFVRFYWFEYPRFTENVFGHLAPYKAIEELAKESKARELVPYISSDVYDGNQEDGRFFESIYFTKPVLKVLPNEKLSPGSILLSHRMNVPGMKYLSTPLPDYHLLTN